LPFKGILQAAIFTLRPSLPLSYTGNVTAGHSSSGRQPNFAEGMELLNFRRRRHLYEAGRPSRWALARILVSKDVLGWTTRRHANSLTQKVNSPTTQIANCGHFATSSIISPIVLTVGV